MSTLQPFHLALPVTDLDAARDFYCGTLGFSTGRTASRWIDLDVYGHQVTLHLVDEDDTATAHNPVDGDDVPARHFGVILDREDWQALADRLQAAGITFLIPPKIRFEGEPGEQATMFFLDPSGNALEFKSFRSIEQLFAR
ncbi:MAG: VOC family protein [Pseudomonadota bacterium]